MAQWLQFMIDFHFLRPMWFLALIPSILILAALWYNRTRSSSWYAAFDRQLLTQLWIDPPGRLSRVPLIMLGIGWLLVILALAGPVWERLPEPVWRSMASRILVLDLSATMMETDLTPSRLERARFKIMDILEKSAEGRTGVVVFAGEPHIVTPLTEDTATITNLLGALSTDIIPEPGNAGAPALQMAGSLLQQAGLRNGDLLLISDGLDDISASLAVARDLTTQGYRLSVLALGATQPDTDALRELARTGGGAFSVLTAGDHDLDSVLLELDQTSSIQARMDTGVERWIERGVWLLPLLLILGAVGFRRGWLSGLLVILMLPPPAQAFEWRDFWLRSDQQAADALAQGQPAVAAQQFTDPSWRGMALFQAGDYAGAAKAFAESDDVNTGYNRGNALAKAGQLNKAAQAYREVLRHIPDHADAKANLALVEELLQQQQDQPQDNAPEDDQSQQPSQSGEEETQQNQGDDEDAAEGDSATENSAEKKQDQDSNQGGDEDISQQNLQDAGSHDQDNQSDQEQADAMESLRQDVTDQVQQQDGHQVNADPTEHPVGEMDESWPVDKPYDETELALEQWLRQIPEDPSGLLRRKFMLEHLQRQQEIK
jgi:Ca-activated chloride channel homolog